MTAEVTVLYFAAASTATALTEEKIPIPMGDDNTPTFHLSKLPELLVARHPSTRLGGVLQTCKWSVNAEMIEEDKIEKTLLKGGDEIAVICPVSGG
jgi:molybdopterin synthase sulfur carrier subunit